METRVWSDRSSHRRATPPTTIAATVEDQELIDLVAMRKGLNDSDVYLEQWAKGAPEMRDGDARTVAEAVAGEIEAKYEAIRSAQLAAIRPSAE